MTFESILFPLIFSTAAGLSTGIGSLISLALKKQSKRFLAVSLGFYGITEPIGALFGIFLLSAFLSKVAINAILASVAGVMVVISLSELLPLSFKQSRKRYVIGGFLTGVFVIMLSLQLF